MRQSDLIEYLDRYLRISEVPDSDRALNGLQVEGDRSDIARIAAAVDASERTIAEAIALGSDLLIVHHGLFWNGGAPVVGPMYRKLRQLLGSGLAVYSAHIPLDVHPEVGNSAVLARALGIEIEGTFGEYRGIEIGYHGRLSLLREALASRLDEVLGGPVRMIAGGPERIGRVGVLTGAGGDFIATAVAAGLDAFVTGEGSHHTYFDAMELGLNVYYGGHYATETWGVRALATHLSETHGLKTDFIDLPTGL